MFLFLTPNVLFLQRRVPAAPTLQYRSPPSRVTHVNTNRKHVTERERTRARARDRQRQRDRETDIVCGRTLWSIAHTTYRMVTLLAVNQTLWIFIIMQPVPLEQELHSSSPRSSRSHATCTYTHARKHVSIFFNVTRGQGLSREGFRLCTRSFV